MKFQILGPIDVQDASGSVALGGTKPRAVLAVLLLHANRPVSAERLALALWGEDAPRAAVKTVQVHVSRLRKALGDPDVVSTTPAGYCLRVRSGELDAERLEGLVEDARRAFADDQPDDAAMMLREALALWRGPALAELALEPFARAEIARLEELRVAALELRVEADLAAGRHAEVVGELTQFVADNSTREQFVGQLMLALYRCGRQSEALDAYVAARRALVDELGIEPGPQLRDLHAAILRQDVALRADTAVVELPPALDPTASQPLVGRDDELWQLRDGHGLRHAVYERMGGVRGAVARLAEEAYSQLENDQRIVARRVLMQLVDVGEGDTVERRRVPLVELELDRDEDLGRVIALLTDRRLLTVGTAAIELAHEALLHEWPRLRAWIEQDREDLRLRRGVSVAAVEWERLGRDDGALFRGIRLEEAVGWRDRTRPTLSGVQREFLDISEAARSRKSIRSPLAWRGRRATKHAEKTPHGFEKPFARISPDEAGLHAQLLGRTAAATEGLTEESLADAAGEMTQRVRDLATLAYADLRRDHDSPELELRRATEIYALAQRLDNAELALIAHSRRVSLLLTLGDLSTVDREIDLFGQVTGSPYEQRGRALALVHRCALAIIQGRFAEAEGLMGDLTGLAPLLQHDPFFPLQLGALAFVLSEVRGRLNELDTRVGHAVASHPMIPVWRCGQLCIDLHSGQRVQLRAGYDRFVDADLKTLPRDNAWLPTLALVAEICAHLGDRVTAGVLRSMLAPYAGRHIVMSQIAYLGPVDRYLALLAATEDDHDAAAKWFAEAGVVATRMGARPTIARLALDEALWLRHRDPLRAAKHAAIALAAAEEVGLDQIVTRARELAPGDRQG